MFFWNSLAFSMIQWMLAILSLVPLLLLNQLEHLEVHVHILLKPGLENFDHYFTRMRATWIVYKSQLSPLPLSLMSLGLHYIQTLNCLHFFNLFYVNLLFNPAKETKRKDEKMFLPL